MDETAVRRRHRAWPSLCAIGLIGAVLAWLNHAPWWGWGVTGAAVILAGLSSRLWRGSHWLVRSAAWVAAAVIVASVAVAAGPLPGTRTLEGPQTEPVMTRQGPVVGIRDDGMGVEAFAGIPYAAPPVGDLRWQAPSPAPARTETLVADDFGPSASQTEPSFVTRALARFIDIPMQQTLLGGYASDEDSLRLNIWRPADASRTAPRPVLVYIHGGSFTGGSGAYPAYDGAGLGSRNGPIVVTVNYRLGVFGFLDESALGGTTRGNQGLLDQLAALRWLQENIAAFGGDPGRVTVAGESAGSGSACILGASPLAAGLLHAIIGESGGCLGTMGDRDSGDLYDDPARTRDAARDLSEALGGATLAEMKEMSASRIAAAAEQFSARWWPSIDGRVLPASPTAIYDAGEHNDVPLLLGSNADETSLALVGGIDSDPDTYVREMQQAHGDAAAELLEMYPGDTAQQVAESRLRAGTDRSMTAPMRQWALAAARTGHAPIYVYYFTRTPPDPDLERFGAYHGAEVMYAYGNLGADGDIDYTAVDHRLEDEMTASWISFASRHDPRNPRVREWPSFQDAPDLVLEFGDVTVVAPRPAARAVDHWLALSG
ncbi:carboxylesterase/lipase family protein [Microbacterium sp. NPDC091313]